MIADPRRPTAAKMYARSNHALSTARARTTAPRCSRTELMHWRRLSDGTSNVPVFRASSMCGANASWGWLDLFGFRRALPFCHDTAMCAHPTRTASALQDPLGSLMSTLLTVLQDCAGWRPVCRRDSCRGFTCRRCAVSWHQPSHLLPAAGDAPACFQGRNMTARTMGLHQASRCTRAGKGLLHPGKPPERVIGIRLRPLLPRPAGCRRGKVRRASLRRGCPRPARSRGHHFRRQSGQSLRRPGQSG